jgi:flagellar M-ring YscJ/FliF-like protein
MSFMTSTRLMRWVIPCCSFLLVLYFATNWSRPNADAAFESLLQEVQAEQAADTPQVREAALVAKAQAVLVGFGEEEPRAVVTVSMTKDWEDVEAYVPIRDSKVLSSIQTTGESLRGDNEYHNTKSAENFDVGHTKTVTHRVGPRVTRVSCLVQVSSQNAHRTQDIERAVAVALGIVPQRGDTVMAVPR